MSKAFSLLELVVAMVIIGVLVSLGMPQYLVTIERARAAEGISTLSAVLGAQLRLRAETGNYAILCRLDALPRRVQCTGIDIDIPPDSLRFFSSIWAHVYNGYDIVAVLVRNDVGRVQTLFGGYVLYVRENGLVCCRDGTSNLPGPEDDIPTTITGTCNRLNITTTCN